VSRPLVRLSPEHLPLSPPGKKEKKGGKRGKGRKKKRDCIVAFFKEEKKGEENRKRPQPIRREVPRTFYPQKKKKRKGKKESRMALAKSAPASRGKGEKRGVSFPTEKRSYSFRGRKGRKKKGGENVFCPPVRHPSAQKKKSKRLPSLSFLKIKRKKKKATPPQPLS